MKFSALRYSGFILLFCLYSNVSHAFNKTGHQIVASSSYKLLDGDGKLFLANVIGADSRQEWIASANWPAEMSGMKGQEWRIPLHRVWFDVEDTKFDANQHCPFNGCVVGAILESKAILKSKQSTPQQKRQAIKYLLHYTADIHQPTNCGFLRDEGGRKIMLKTPELTKVNLHWVWESGILQNHGQNWSQISSSLLNELSTETIQEWRSEMDPQVWAWECHNEARNTAYKLALDGKWGMTYYKKAWPTYEQQLQKAAVRLANMINEIAFELK